MRPKTSMVRLGARAQTIPPTANPASPTENTALTPKKSEILPYSGTPTAYASEYPVTTHPTSAAEAPNCALMRGMRTLIIVAVSTDTKTADTATARNSRVDAGLSYRTASLPALTAPP
jgi:hypothetical protein